jgi:import receptor subunit TOM70
LQEKKEFATKLKAAGNKQFGSKDYNKAIDLYTKAIELRQDPIYYSNRAACHQALGEWEKVIEDTTAAISLDSMYVKALNRRANAYEQVEKYRDALLDYTASCIIDKFQSQQSAQKVETLLQKVATQKGTELYASKKKKLPSVAFVSNYLSSYRAKPIPEDLSETADIPETSGRYELRKALLSIEKRSWQDYNDAFDSIGKAIEMGNLGTHEALAYNLRATFRWLIGDTATAMEDINKSIELDPDLIQSYVKRATMYLENGESAALLTSFAHSFIENRIKAQEDFAEAAKRAPEDPDVFYNRGQSHFIMGEFQEAATDYQKSIDFDPDFMFSHIQMAVTQYKQGSIASALATFRKSIKKFPSSPEVYNYFGEILLDQQQYQKAIENFDQAIELEKTAHPQAMNVLPLVNKALTIFQWKQQLKQAQELCEKALLRKFVVHRYTQY